MTVTGLIYDRTENVPLERASIVVYNSGGNTTGEGTMTDADGFFSITSNTLNNGGKLMVSDVSHQTVIVDPNVFNLTPTVYLDIDPNELTPVVVTPGQKKNIWPYLTLGGGLLLLASTRKKKRSMSMGAVNFEWKWVGYAAIAAGSYFIIVKPILQSLHLLPNNQQADTNKQAVATSISQLQQQGGPQSIASFSGSQYVSMANSIYQLGYADNPDGMVDILKQMQTMMDVLKLVEGFGTKDGPASFWSACALIHYDCPQVDLPAFVHSFLSSDQITEVNSYYAQRGIPYRL